MSNFFKLYLLTRLDTIAFTCSVILILSGIGILIYHLVRGMECYDKDDLKSFKEDHGYILKFLTWFFFISMFFTFVTPSKTDAIIIYAGGKTMDFVEQDSSINKIPSQTTKIITDILENKIQELNKNTK